MGSPSTPTPWCEHPADQPPDCVHVRVKAVPGASRDAIAGVLGDRLKVRVAAPPEGGKANRAIAALLAKSLSLRGSDVQLLSGTASAEKVFRIEGLPVEVVRDRLTGGDA